MAGQAAGALGGHYRRFDIDSESDRNLRRTTAVRRMCSAGPQLQRSARTEVPSLWVLNPSMMCAQRPHTPWANPGRWLSLVGVPSQPLALGGRQGAPATRGSRWPCRTFLTLCGGRRFLSALGRFPSRRTRPASV